MTNHTPGPWSIKKALGNTGLLIDSKHYIVADLYANPEAATDARLISAAPELLEALKAIMDPVTNSDEALYMHSRELARAAIAKAEGRSE